MTCVRGSHSTPFIFFEMYCLREREWELVVQETREGKTSDCFIPIFSMCLNSFHLILTDIFLLVNKYIHYPESLKQPLLRTTLVLV